MYSKKILKILFISILSFYSLRCLNFVPYMDKNLTDRVNDIVIENSKETAYVNLQSSGLTSPVLIYQNFLEEDMQNRPVTDGTLTVLRIEGMGREIPSDQIEKLFEFEGLPQGLTPVYTIDRDNGDLLISFKGDLTATQKGSKQGGDTLKGVINFLGVTVNANKSENPQKIKIPAKKIPFLFVFANHASFSHQQIVGNPSLLPAQSGGNNYIISDVVISKDSNDERIFFADENNSSVGYYDLIKDLPQQVTTDSVLNGVTNIKQLPTTGKVLLITNLEGNSLITFEVDKDYSFHYYRLEALGSDAYTLQFNLPLSTVGITPPTKASGFKFMQMSYSRSLDELYVVIGSDNPSAQGTSIGYVIKGFLTRGDTSSKDAVALIENKYAIGNLAKDNFTGVYAYDKNQILAITNSKNKVYFLRNRAFEKKLEETVDISTFNNTSIHKIFFKKFMGRNYFYFTIMTKSNLQKIVFLKLNNSARSGKIIDKKESGVGFEFGGAPTGNIKRWAVLSDLGLVIAGADNNYWLQSVYAK